MVNDPIADLLIRIKNAYLARKDLVEMPWSKILEGMAKILKDCGYLKKAEVKRNKFKTLVLSLQYIKGRPALTDVRRVSKPGVRRYIKAKNIKPVLDGLGIVIISTPEGLMTGKEAKKKSLGGEILAEVW